MTKQNSHFVPLLTCLKKHVLLMGLAIVLLLSGTFQISAASVSEDQQKTVSGRITDANNQPLPGVNILEKGTLNGAISDADGKFSMNVASANSVLVFSFVGYTTQEVTVGSQSSINVTLAESAIGLDEIVVVGYGTQ